MSETVLGPLLFTHVAVFNASLNGIGILWYNVDKLTGVETPLGGCSMDWSALLFGDSTAFQNTAEFIATVLTV